MAGTPKQKTPEEQLTAIAAEAVSQMTGIEDQLQYLENALNKNKTLRVEVHSHVWRLGLLRVLYNARDTVVDRTKAIKPNDQRVHAVCERGMDAVASTITSPAIRSLLDIDMGGNKRLGDLLGTELDPLIERSSRWARGHEADAEFFRKLRARVGDDETVRSKISDSAVQSLWKKSHGGNQVKLENHSACEPAVATGHGHVDTHSANAGASAA